LGLGAVVKSKRHAGGGIVLISSARGFTAAFVIYEEIPQCIYRMVVKPIF
jgi:hypothetical protein